MGNPGRLERFRREARALAALHHPHIVTMELIQGQSLDRRIPEAGLVLSRV